jgi:hypothetical protein
MIPSMSMCHLFLMEVGNLHDRGLLLEQHCCATMTSYHISARMAKDATMTSDHISATITYVMWCETHLWNVSVLQRVHHTNLVIFITFITCTRPDRVPNFILCSLRQFYY